MRSAWQEPNCPTSSFQLEAFTHRAASFRVERFAHRETAPKPGVGGWRTSHAVRHTMRRGSMGTTTDWRANRGRVGADRRSLLQGIEFSLAPQRMSSRNYISRRNPAVPGMFSPESRVAMKLPYFPEQTYTSFKLSLPVSPGFEAFSLSYHWKNTLTGMFSLFAICATPFQQWLASWPCTDTPADGRNL